MTLRRVHLIHHAGLTRSCVAKRIEAHSAQRTEHTARVQLLHTKFDSSHAFRTRLAPIVEARASVHALFELIMKSDQDGLRQALLQGADPNVVDGCVWVFLFCISSTDATAACAVRASRRFILRGARGTLAASTRLSTPAPC